MFFSFILDGFLNINKDEKQFEKVAFIFLTISFRINEELIVNS